MTRSPKPGLQTAMQDLIVQIRTQVPFDTPTSTLCQGPCTGCSKKLMEFLDTEVSDWECRLNAGDIPSFGDIHALAKRSRKIHGVLKQNGIIDAVNL
ncbi:hypothetical protein DV711_18290 [Motiliproteus coralliicola]|uniref:Uncharacterized protein n=1 Tax=Motiliproteus coralliicola TaxID=2283196 RepID=A0A369W9T7_9GAMM|nr:hypothetical protein [Motiliproteus coralliicola]RDE18073.1 hypothetical protein DV711_18290 [Motiliproteus coralliicola]